MTLEQVLRAMGDIACVFALGLFIAGMSVTTLKAASQKHGVVCTDRFCTETVHQSHSLGTKPNTMHRIVAMLD